MTNPFFISLPSYPSSPKGVQATNTLAITALPKDFFEPTLLAVLRAHFATYGNINRWVPLPSFSRIIVIYSNNDDAETAKTHCDPIVLAKTNDRSSITLRVYRADPNPLLPPGDIVDVPAANYLQPPKVEKNFLISPPGSPPVGWEPVKEEPPNATPLADDLIAALRKLQMHDREKSAGLELLIDPKDGDAGVGIYVEDCSSSDDEYDADEEWVYGQPPPFRTRWVSTAMPPMESKA
ncbi:Calcipressin [Mycena amicta]|nr:Calcipressin [Mycena amicta]